MLSVFNKLVHKTHPYQLVRRVRVEDILGPGGEWYSREADFLRIGEHPRGAHLQVIPLRGVGTQRQHTHEQNRLKRHI